MDAGWNAQQTGCKNYRTRYISADSKNKIRFKFSDNPGSFEKCSRLLQDGLYFCSQAFAFYTLATDGFGSKTKVSQGCSVHLSFCADKKHLTLGIGTYHCLSQGDSRKEMPPGPTTGDDKPQVVCFFGFHFNVLQPLLQCRQDCCAVQ